MKMHIDMPRKKIAAFCRANGVSRLELFGSVLRDDFGPDSFEEGARSTLLDLADMEEEPKAIFGRDVDLVSWRGVERSRNYLRRKATLESAETIHAAR